VNTNSRAVTLTWPVRHRFPLPRASQECAQAGRMSSDQSHNKAMNPPAAATRRPRVMANVTWHGCHRRNKCDAIEGTCSGLQ
jgi:hypothetical protein